MPQTTYLPLVSIVFTVLILTAALKVLGPFLLPILWAAIIAIAGWPLHVKIRDRVKRNDLAALATTTFLGLTIALPMVALLAFIVHDVYAAASYLLGAEQTGLTRPEWLARVPWAGDMLAQRWDQFLGRPNRLSAMLGEVLSTKLDIVQSLAHSVLLNLSGRAAVLFFALWVLYFFFRDGEKIIARLNLVGYRWLPKRWPSYAYNIPGSVRAAVNGLVFVGIAEGVAASTLCFVFGVPSPVLLGTLVALVALIPFAAPLLLGILGGFLFLKGDALSGVLLFALGTTLILLAENVLRPLLTKGSTDLPFLATLFGIFGGIAAFGIVGLVLGPVILVLFLVLLKESVIDETADLEF